MRRLTNAKGSESKEPEAPPEPEEKRRRAFFIITYGPRGFEDSFRVEQIGSAAAFTSKIPNLYGIREAIDGGQVLVVTKLERRGVNGGAPYTYYPESEFEAIFSANDVKRVESDFIAETEIPL